MSFETISTPPSQAVQPETSDSTNANPHAGSSDSFSSSNSNDRLLDGPPPSSSPSMTSINSLSSQPSGDVETRSSALNSAEESSVSTSDVDPQIIEALKSKDRLFVLKLGEQMEALIRERNLRTRTVLTPENPYQRLLVHRCAAHYKLSPESEPNTRNLAVCVTTESKIPSRRVSELVPVEQIPQPAFKIMMRSEQDRKRQKPSLSRADSIAGEDGEFSDVDPSETGSVGSRSTTSKNPLSLAERQAAYEKARSRIFMDFEGKSADRDTSASSSTLSLISASGSGSQNGGVAEGSVSDIDDVQSLAPTENEWSVSNGTDRRRLVEPRSSAGISRPYRSGATSYNGHTSGSGHASGSASPAFTYPSLYDPSGSVPPQDPLTYVGSPGAYMAAPYPIYPYTSPPMSSQAQVTTQPYLQSYPYYHQYSYPPTSQPPHSGQTVSDPSSPVAGPIDGYQHPMHVQSVPYMNPNPYMWPQVPAQPLPPQTPQHHSLPLDSHSPPVHGPHQGSIPQSQSSPSVQYPAQPFPPYMPGPGPMPYPGYPISAPYYPQLLPAPPHPSNVMHPNSHATRSIELPSANGNSSDQGMSSGVSSRVSSGNGSPSPTYSRHSNGSTNGHHHNNVGIANKRGAPAARGAWSYGPGISMHGSATGVPIHYPSSSGNGGETVGPRLSGIRKTSGASSASGGNRTPADETASTTSSSTSSSSSRRTYMSTPSKHPLPPRPDWAAGLKPQPTLHAARHRHDGNTSSRNMSPARPLGGYQSQNQPHRSLPQQTNSNVLLPTDFPPLSSIPIADKRPIVNGVWTNPNSAARSILMPNPSHQNNAQGNTYGTALFNHGMNVPVMNGSQNLSLGTHNRLEDDEQGFERPAPKASAVLFNPKGGTKSAASAAPLPHASSSVQTQTQAQARVEKDRYEKDKARGEAVASAILVDKIQDISILDEPGGYEDEGAASLATGKVAPTQDQVESTSVVTNSIVATIDSTEESSATTIS